MRRLDAFLATRVFQAVVDAAQRQPAWLSRQCALLGALVVALRHYFVGISLLATVVSLVCLLLAGAITLLPASIASIGTLRWVRYTLLLFLAFDAVALALLPGAAARIASSTLLDLAWIGFYYFAACHPPRPRVPRPRGRLAHGGAL